jgi:hypothetical protein
MSENLCGKYECRWTVTHRRQGRVLWEIVDKKNTLVDTGERAILDTFFCDLASNYFGMTDFWVGLYNGAISETTVLTTIPNEPAVAYGYSRQRIERSTIGWPTAERHEGDWRRVSKLITLTASGGSIGPVNGAFLCTSSDDTGTLIGVQTFGVERTVVSGDTFDLQIKAKLK